MLAKHIDLRGVVKPAPGPLPYQVHRWEPPDVLTPYLDWFWAVSYALPDGERIEQMTLPDPVVHLVVEDSQALVNGPMSGRFERVLHGSATVLGARFRPAMFGNFAADMWVLRDTQQAPESFDGLGAFTGVPDSDLQTQQATLSSWLLKRLPERPDPRLARARDWTEQIASDRAIVDLDTAAEGAGVSVRTLQRTMRRVVGWTPSEVIRRRRIQDAVATVAQCTQRPGGLADLALELGYCDQAHLCRDFKTLLGLTPMAYVRRCAASDPTAESG